jgi:hypothetical protein
MDESSSTSSEDTRQLSDQSIANYRAIQYGGNPLPCKMGVYYGNCTPSSGAVDNRSLIDG